jgi:glycosyltransferase involved in cell wall biosynthesis
MALGIRVDCVGERSSRAVRLALVSAEVRKHRPDIVQSVHFFTNLYATGAARLGGAREIGAIRNDVLSEIRGSGALLGRLSLRMPRLMAANSHAALARAAALGVPKSRLHLLQNVIDTDSFTPGNRVCHEGLTVLSVGRLVPQKRFDRLLSILSRLSRATTRRVKAIVVGSGPLKPQLERQALELNLLPNAIEFRNAVDDMPSVYREADAFVLTSDFEGTPNVVLEAMATGLPVVATPVGGVPDVILHGQTGYLFAPQDEDHGVEILRALAEDRDNRDAIGRRARAHILDTHSLARLPGILAALYERALQ